MANENENKILNNKNLSQCGLPENQDTLDHGVFEDFSVSKSEDSSVNSSNIDSNKIANGKKYNIQNLKPITSVSQAREMGRKGGLKSGETRRKKKTMRETLQSALMMELSNKKLQELGADVSLMNGDNSVLSAIVASAIREAINGDIRSLQTIRDTIGESPITKTADVTEIITADDMALIDDMKKHLIG